MQESSQKSIFYSWQSDLPMESNQKGIRYCLQIALAEVNTESEQSILTIEEATSREPGSPQIPDTIFAKIAKADIFVSDISTINSNDNTKRKTPNPNVLIELGYAVAILGWGRIIMLFNKNYGDFPSDLPFDLDKRRITTYSIKDKSDKGGKGTLTAVLKDAINIIVESNPPKPNQTLPKSKEQIHRERDIRNIETLLIQIDITAVDSFIESLPEMIVSSAFHYLYSFKSVYEKSSFYLYNKDLSKVLGEFDDIWTRTLDYGNYFYKDPMGETSFYIPFDIFPSKDAETAFNRLAIESRELADIFKNLISSLREQYHEIDIDELSAHAAANYKMEIEKFTSLDTVDNMLSI